MEAAINTYVKPDGCHKLFESETDLVYLPDLKRYLIFLTHEVRSGIEYLEALISELGNKIEMLGHTQQDLEHWLGAGKKILGILENSHKKPGGGTKRPPLRSGFWAFSGGIKNVYFFLNLINHMSLNGTFEA